MPTQGFEISIKTALMCLGLMTLAACSGSRDVFLASPEAVQRIYLHGVPHIDGQGARRSVYSPSESFLPIGLYHALSGEHNGRSYDFSPLRAAGFNTVHAWEMQKLEPVAQAAAANNLKLIFFNPTDDDVRRQLVDRDSPVLAWYLEQEPTKPVDDPAWRSHLSRFRARHDAIRTLDPIRPGLIIDTPFMTGPRAERWINWNTAADITSHFNYPILNHATPSLSAARGIPETVARAVALNAERKPVWFVVQAFASPHQGWNMPDATQLRAMAYAALIHGATGIIYFSLDSFVTRDDGVIGISPDTLSEYGPAPDYNGDGRPPLVADDALLKASRTLWSAASSLNRELAALQAELLTATSPRDYMLEIAGHSHSPVPIRTLLKERDGIATLFAVNLDNRPLQMRVTFDTAVHDLSVLFANVEAPTSAEHGWTDQLGPFASRVYRFSFSGN